MPSPVGHALMGVVAGVVVARGLRVREADAPLTLLGAYAFVGNAPDLDFVPGLLLSDPNRFHHGISHSLGAALLCSLLAGLVGARWLKWRLGHGFGLGFALYASHILLDALAYDFSVPQGQPLLWPITSQYFESPVLIFLNIDRTSVMNGFWSSLFSLHNFRAIGLELLMLMPPCLLVLAKMGRRPTVPRRGVLE